MLLALFFIASILSSVNKGNMFTAPSFANEKSGVSNRHIKTLNRIFLTFYPAIRTFGAQKITIEYSVQQRPEALYFLLKPTVLSTEPIR